MKITTTECTVEEYTELKKAENETTINIPTIKADNAKAVADMVKKIEFIRKARECGRVNF